MRSYINFHTHGKKLHTTLSDHEHGEGCCSDNDLSSNDEGCPCCQNGIDLDEDLHFPKPRCHSKDYDEIIMMMEMEVQNEVSLTQDEFSKYVQDQWHWKSDFDFISSSYKRR